MLKQKVVPGSKEAERRALLAAEERRCAELRAQLCSVQERLKALTPDQRREFIDYLILHNEVTGILVHAGKWLEQLVEHT